MVSVCFYGVGVYVCMVVVMMLFWAIVWMVRIDVDEGVLMNGCG